MYDPRTPLLLLILIAACEPWTRGDDSAGLDLDGDGYYADSALSPDCNDTDPTIFPGAPEQPADGIDSDCDGMELCFVDADGDGYGAGDVPEPVASLTCTTAGTSLIGGDCDDTEAGINPDATERCNELDDDCDGRSDDVPNPPGFLLDHDDDGYGDANFPWYGCNPPLGYIPLSAPTDCDDFDGEAYPGAVEQPGDGVDQDCDGVDDCYIDADRDGHGAGIGVPATTLDCSAPGEAIVADDCDDANPARSPSAPEACGLTDSDCDGIPGDLDPDLPGQPSWYLDDDDDGFGDPSTRRTACTPPPRHVSNAADCDDSNPSVSPVAEEICNGLDDDCDGALDDADPSLSDPEMFYLDLDNDGWGFDGSPRLACTGADPYDAPRAGDCNDAARTVNPDADEVVGNTIDEDCDGALSCYGDGDGDGSPGHTVVTTTELTCAAAGLWVAPIDCNDDDASSTVITYFPDLDGDGFGGPDGAIGGCTRPTFFTTVDGDCDDSDPEVYPGGIELPVDGIDGDCDGTEQCYVDADGDGSGNGALQDSTDTTCASDGFTLLAGDCDDGDPERGPGMLETVADRVDNDCDGTELCFADLDGDGVGGTTLVRSPDLNCTAAGSSLSPLDCDDSDPSVTPGGPESCTGVDDNCNGLIDDDDPSLESATVWYRDADGDGLGDPSLALAACQAPQGYVMEGTDCDDASTLWGVDCPWGEVRVGFGLVCARRVDGETACATDAGGVPISQDYSALDADERGFCGIGTDGEISCFAVAGATALSPPSGAYLDLSMGTRTACALDELGAPACWGDDTWGVVANTPPSAGFDHIAASDHFACAWTGTAPAQCWGLGVCATYPQGDLSQLAIGRRAVCRLDAGGALTCGGCAGPILADAPGGTFVDLDVGIAGACAVRPSGQVLCWGELGSLDLTPPNLPVPTRSVQVGAGGVCAIGDDGQVRCWGDVPDASFLQLLP